MTGNKVPANLIVVSDGDRGIVRKCCGKGSIYLDACSKKIQNDEIIRRIQSFGHQRETKFEKLNNFGEALSTVSYTNKPVASEKLKNRPGLDKYEKLLLNY